MKYLPLIACLLAPPAAAETPTILTIGDSIMEWNGDRSIPSVMARELGWELRDESVSGARLRHPARLLVGPMDIRAQVPRIDFDWIVMTGGGNDMAVHCGCNACEETLDGLVTADGTFGAMPDFLDLMGSRGAQVLYVGYYDNPVGGGPFTGCEAAIGELESRLENLAQSRERFHFIDASDVYDSSDLTLYDEDRLHPSPKGSDLLGRWISVTLGALAE